MNILENEKQVEVQNELFTELENELRIEELEERLEMTTDTSGGSKEPPKLPWPG